MRRSEKRSSRVNGSGKPRRPRKSDAARILATIGANLTDNNVAITEAWLEILRATIAKVEKRPGLLGA